MRLVFPLMTIAFVLIALVFHGLFIMYDYAYYNPDSGGLLKVAEVFNETLNDEYRNLTWNQTMMFRQAFGMGRFIVMGLSLLFLVISVLDVVGYEPGKKER